MERFYGIRIALVLALAVAGCGGGGGDEATTTTVISGALDGDFNGNGKVTTAVGTGLDEGYAVAMQSDGKVIVAGRYVVSGLDDNFAIVRYNANGHLDTTFDGDGKVTTDFSTDGDNARAIAVQADGKIVAAGYANLAGNNVFAVARYNTDGSLDATFDGDGKVTTDVGTGGSEGGRAIAIQSDGKIVVAGFGFQGSNFDFAVVRYNANGSPDSTFDGDGIAMTSIATGFTDAGNAIALQSDGKIVVAGNSNNGTVYNQVLVRYHANGIPDSSFGALGIVTVSIGYPNEGNAVAIQSDGKIVMAGMSYSGTAKFVVARFNTDGSLDTAFDGDGKVTTAISSSGDWANAIAIQSDGKILVAGQSSNDTNADFAVVRYETNGSLDLSFDLDGKVTTPIGSSDDRAYAIAIQSDGKIVLAGTSSNGTNNDIAVVRYK